MNRFIFAPLSLLALALFLSPALAQDTNVHVGGLWGVLRPYIADLIGIGVAGLIAYLSMLLRTKFGIEIEARHREALHSAAVTGVNMALGQLNGRVEGLTVDVKNKLLADAMTYVIKSVPDAIRFFELDQKADALRDILKSKMASAIGPSA
mgnify:CR=1 FL=1